MKKTVPINSGWLFKNGFDKKDLSGDDIGGFIAADLPYCGVSAPSSYFDARKAEGICTYTRILFLPKEYEGSRLILRFEKVIGFAEVYVNSEFVTSHRGDTPFTADITALMLVGKENRIVVKTDSTCREDVPFSGGTMLVPAADGIAGAVFLDIIKGGNIAAVLTDSAPDPMGEGYTLEAFVRLDGHYPDAELTAQILSSSGETVAALPKKAVLSRDVTLKGFVKGAKGWTPETPDLYTLKVTLFSGEEILDEFTLVFGFISPVFGRDGFYLNGKKTFITGYNYNGLFPYVLRASTATLQRTDARLIKELGVNTVRYIGCPTESFLSECDRIGLMVIVDMSEDGRVGNAHWLETLTAMLTDTIQNYYNHPSIIAWGTRPAAATENYELFFKTASAAKKADPSRSTLGTRCGKSSQYIEDVYGRLVFRLKDIGKVRGGLDIAAGKSLPAYASMSRGIAAKKRLIKIMSKAAASKSCGIIYGDAFDYNTGAGFGGSAAVSMAGAYDMFRSVKSTALASKSQSAGGYIIEAAGNPADIKLTRGVTVFSNCERVRISRADEVIAEVKKRKRKGYKHIKNPPFVIDNLGYLLVKKHVKGGQKARLMSFVLKNMTADGRLSKGGRVSAALRILKTFYSVSPADIQAFAAECYGADAVYRLDGIVADKVEASAFITSAPFSKAKLTLTSLAGDVVSCRSGKELFMLSLTVSDEYGNRPSYDFSPVFLSATGSVKLVSPKTVTMQAGAAGIMAAAVSGGKGTVRADCRWGSAEIEIDVEYVKDEL